MNSNWSRKVVKYWLKIERQFWSKVMHWFEKCNIIWPESSIIFLNKILTILAVSMFQSQNLNVNTLVFFWMNCRFNKVTSWWDMHNELKPIWSILSCVVSCWVCGSYLDWLWKNDIFGSRCGFCRVWGFTSHNTQVYVPLYSFWKRAGLKMNCNRKWVE